MPDFLKDDDDDEPKWMANYKDKYGKWKAYWDKKRKEAEAHKRHHKTYSERSVAG
jgi:hypothetical protein